MLDEDARSIVELIRAGTVDPQLAALLWLTTEGRVPVVVAAGPQGAGASTLLAALLAFLPSDAVVRGLRGYDEDFAWLREADLLGWRPDAATNGRTADSVDLEGSEADVEDDDRTERRQPTSANGFLVAAELGPNLPWHTWGEQARVAVRATSLGYGLGATMHGDSLEDVFRALRGPDVRLTDDELSAIGVVLVLRALRTPRGVVRRVAAAHYVRPVFRDSGGHVQRLAPAVLATWDGTTDRFEHFSWGVTAELAGRVGRRPGDFEAEHVRRRDVLEALAAAEVTAPDDVRAAIDGYRLSGSLHHH